jgi:hypothetical protein
MRTTPGYAALITVVMVMLTVTAIGLTLTVLSADSLLSTLRFDRGVDTQAMADTCAYEAAVQLRNQGLAYVGSHTVTQGTDSCAIVVTNTSGTIAHVEIDAQHSQDHRLVEQDVDVSTMEMLLWQEVSD